MWSTEAKNNVFLVGGSLTTLFTYIAGEMCHWYATNATLLPESKAGMIGWGVASLISLVSAIYMFNKIDYEKEEEERIESDMDILDFKQFDDRAPT